MRATVAVTLAFASLVVGATGSAGVAARTSLTITYWERGMTAGEPVRWTLRCNPARGTLPRPGRACRRLAQASPRIFAPVPSDRVCTEIYGGPQTARIVGTFRGRRVHATFNRTDGCEIARWDGLSPWLLPAARLAR